MPQPAFFTGLIVDEKGEEVSVAYVGSVPHYVVNDAGFLFHIPAEKIDRQILALMQESILSNREAVVASTLQFMGQEDLFTKAAVEASIEQMDENMDKLLDIGLPEDARAWLGMMGFRVVIDIHGDIVDVQMPGLPDIDEE